MIWSNMNKLFTLAIALAIMLPLSRAKAQMASISVNASQVLHTNSLYLTGACIEDVNHEIYGGLYSQMIFGESFQEPAPFSPLNKREVSAMWRGFCRGSAQGGWSLETQEAFTGRQSQRMTFQEGDGEVGIENQSLNRWGMNFVKSKRYEGQLWLRAEQPVRLFLALESADGSKVYGETHVEAESPQWRRIDFKLTPNADDKAGRFAIKLRGPGSVCLGYAFLQPGEWGRFKRLPVRKDVSEALVAQGLTVLRYGGSMVNHAEYRLKKMIGPPDHRPPYKGTWYPYSSNGWGIPDFLNFCEAAGFLGIPAVNMDERPSDMAGFMEYVNGTAKSAWGRRRAADGHPARYRLKYLELGNEEAVNEDYWKKFKPLAEAIWAKDPAIILVVGDFAYDKVIQDPYNFSGAPTIKTLAAHKKILDLAREHGREVWFDVHIETEHPPAPNGVPGLRIFIEQLVLLCYVESAKTSSNFRPQQWQKPIHRSNHGRILLSVCSHVTPEVFFGAQVDDRDKQIRQDGQDQVVMKPAPAAPLEMIQAQIGLPPLEILFDIPAGTAQAQHSRLLWRSVQMRQVIMIRFGIARGPIDDQPEFFQIGRSPIQGSRQINLHPRQARAPRLPIGRFPGTGVPLRLLLSGKQLGQRQRFGVRLPHLPARALTFQRHR